MPAMAARIVVWFMTKFQWEEARDRHGAHLMRWSAVRRRPYVAL
jgi:hypothetical protein